MPHVGIVIACSKGLLHIGPKWNIISEINSGCYTSAHIDNGTLYALEHNTKTIMGYRYRGGCWVKHSGKRLPHSGLNTTSVNHGITTICNQSKHMIHVIDMCGRLLHTYGQEGTEGAGYLKSPRLCQVDSEGVLLVADTDNHRLQVREKHGQWSIIDVEPHLRLPERAVYVDGTLYVQGGAWPNYKLGRYIAK